MSDLITVGLDLAKNLFQMHGSGVDKTWASSSMLSPMLR